MLPETLSPLELFLLCLAALVAGSVDAIGGGGGLVTLPALLQARLETLLALGTNKGQSVFGTAAAIVAFWRAGKIDRGRALLVIPLSAAGAVLGAFIATWLEPEILKPVVLVLLVLSAAMLALSPQPGPRDPPSPRTARAITAAIALVLGVYDGFFGPGAGTLLILAFATFLGTPLPLASADAKVANIASSLAALVTFVAKGQVLWGVALPMAGAQLVGGVLGAQLVIRGGAKVVRVVVLVVIAALIMKLGWELVSGLVRPDAHR